MKDPNDPINEIAKDLDRLIPASDRLLMLDLVMVWARVDTSIGQMASTLFGMTPSIGAIVFNRMRVQDRLKRCRDLCLQIEHAEGAAHFKKLRTDYERHSKPRNLIAHACCIGITRLSPRSLVFLPFEAEGGFGNLAIEQLPMPMVQDAIEWGERIDADVIAYLNENEFWEKHD